MLPLGEVENTLTAALADPEVAEEVRLGRLVKPIEYAGFGETAASPTPAGPRRRRHRRKPRGMLRNPGAPKEAPKGARRDRGKAVPESGAKVSTLADDARAAGGRPPPSKRRRAGRSRAGRSRQDAERAEFERRAEAEHEAAKQRAAEQEAARKAAAEQRRRQQTAHRELLTARTALAEAEAQRAEAEKAVRAAKRRVEQALAAVQAATPE